VVVDQALDAALGGRPPARSKSWVRGGEFRLRSVPSRAFCEGSSCCAKSLPLICCRSLQGSFVMRATPGINFGNTFFRLRYTFQDGADYRESKGQAAMWLRANAAANIPCQLHDAARRSASACAVPAPPAGKTANGEQSANIGSLHLMHIHGRLRSARLGSAGAKTARLPQSLVTTSPAPVPAQEQTKNNQKMRLCGFSFQN